MKKPPLPIKTLPLPFGLIDASKMLREAIRCKNARSIKIIFHALSLQTTIPMDERVPINPRLDTIVYDLSSRFGPIDIVVFHVDGSATLIVVKDGTKGYRHVVSGLGLASLHSVQLKQAKCAVVEVRKALLWTSTGNLLADIAVEDACAAANTAAMPWGTLAEHIDAVRASLCAREVQTDADKTADLELAA